MKLLRLSACLAILLSGYLGEAAAIGFGELHGVAVLGERPVLTVELLGAAGGPLDPACFRLRRPADADLPWLADAVLSIRKGAQPVLEIKPTRPLREPVFQIALQMTCGQDVAREYMLLASPAAERGAEKSAATTVTPPLAAPLPPAMPRGERSARPERLSPVRSAEPRQRAQGRRTLPAEPPVVAASLPDRLVLSGDVGEVGDPSLRLAVDLGMPASEPAESQRELLRLEYRLLLALQDQSLAQMSTSERLRAMEENLSLLRRQGEVLGQQAEKPASQVAEPVLPPVAVPAKPPVANDTVLTEWALYGLLLGLLVGIGGWLGWRNYRERITQRRDVEFQMVVPDIEIDPLQADELDATAGVDIPVEPVGTAGTTHIDLHLDAADDLPPSAVNVPTAVSRGGDSSLNSISSATVDEHFEANPVMELADIMLSFGRVKGAAQALQEFIDNNPQEALQPWIRLMEVYRMAGMQSEFETVARNLNRNFNVEVQPWDEGSLASIDIPLDQPDAGVGADAAMRAGSLEEMPRIMEQLSRLWAGGEVRDYLEQLLRDNRGGKRAGFSMPVVGEILFLIELKDTIYKMEREEEQHE